MLLILVSAFFVPTGGAGSANPPAAEAPPAAVDGIPPEVLQALFGLKDKDSEARQKIYTLLGEKGDARLIPVLEGYLAGQLQPHDGHLAVYGPAKEVESPETGAKKKYFPLIDAFSSQPFLGSDGQPIFEQQSEGHPFPRPVTAPQRSAVLDLIATLSLLHPDPEIRLKSIREAGERAARVFSDSDDEDKVKIAMQKWVGVFKSKGRISEDPAAVVAEPKLLAAIDAASTDKPKGLLDPVPSASAISAVAKQLDVFIKAGKEAKDSAGKPIWPASGAPSTDLRVDALVNLDAALREYQDRLSTLKKNSDELPKYAAALHRQLTSEPNSSFAPALKEATAETDVVLGDRQAQLAAITALGEIGTARAENMLGKTARAAARIGDTELFATAQPALAKASSYQRIVRMVQYTFAGLSTGSIYVLLALGLAIIFGLMGVINMAHGEFMMVGAFTTYVVAQWFKASFPSHYDYFPIVAVPAAFLVAGLVGLLTEYLVIRHLYGRTTETLLATIGVGLVLVQVAQDIFGNNVSYNAPRWMQGSMEVATDLNLNRARFWTILYCMLCIAVVYFIVNKTKLGLLLRATTQNRKMAAALGVPTRGVDAMTFAFGAGLAGMAGVVVPMIDKINPNMGQDYVVMSFMVVVVGGVGKLAGSIIAGFGLGAIGNYLEPLLSNIHAFATTSSVLGKVLVLAAIVAFLQRRPSGLFPPKGRVADA